MFWVQVSFRLLFLTAVGLIALCRPSDATPDYRIHSGDVLNIQVYGEQTLSQPTTVLTDGTIVYPLVGHLTVGGETIPLVTRQLTTALGRYINDPIVSVAVLTQGPLNVLVLGNVKLPGKYSLPPDSRLTDAIAAAGGIGPTDGAFPTARISIGTQNLQTVSLQKLLHDGNVALNIPLESNSVVYVPSPSIIRVRVIGAVDKPGDIEIGEGDHLSLAIAKAGSGPATHADLNHVHVTRANVNGTSTNFEVNLYRELQQGDMRGDPVLQKGDLVFVPQNVSGGGQNGSGALVILRRLFLPSFGY